MIIRWLHQTCTMTMLRPWQHISTHVSCMTMIWSCHDYEVNMTYMMWQQHDNAITIKWSWDDHGIMVVSFLSHGHGRVILFPIFVSCWLCQHRVMIVTSSWYVRTLVIGANILINGHSRSFMSISLPSLVFLKVMLWSLFKITHRVMIDHTRTKTGLRHG